MAQQHIPKFGSWDADNVPYTAYFDNARKDKGGTVRINPNDPEENPDAFRGRARGGRQTSVGGSQKSGSRKNRTSDSGSDRSSSDQSFQQNDWRSSRKKSSNERPKNFVPPSPGRNRPRHGYNPADDIASLRSASVPMFGAWDEKDPNSGDGFTVIFQKVKEEKHIAASKFPPIPQQPANVTAAQKKEKPKPKMCCCFF